MAAKRNITGIILAGGKSSRMGRDKGVLPIKGKTMVQHVTRALSPLVDDIIIIANNNNYNDLGYPVYSDMVESRGPLSGIYTGLHHSATNKNIVVSCDVPGISAELLKYLLNNSTGYDVTIPVHNDKTEPLIGVYTKNCTGVIKHCLEMDELRVNELVNFLNHNKVDINKDLPFYNERLFVNINTPNELKLIEDDY